MSSRAWLLGTPKRTVRERSTWQFRAVRGAPDEALHADSVSPRGEQACASVRAWL
jgi:hypothetical protein